MHLDTLKYFYEKTVYHNPAFIYRGPFEDQFTGVILDMAQINQNNTPQESAVNKKVSFILVECFQNLLKHAENMNRVEHFWQDEGMFCFKNFEDGFVINSVNIIRNDEVSRLESIVLQVNSMSGEDLKSYYLDRLRNNEMSSKGGAGLGLIELARKSGQKILYKIEPLGNGFSLFHQQITLLRHGETEDKFQNELEENHIFYQEMMQKDLRLVFKGDVSNKSILPILNFIKTYVDKHVKLKKSVLKAAHVLIEVSQNISKYAASSEGAENKGILMLGEREGHIVILSGNTVGLSNKILLEQKLSYLISLEEEELVELHKNALRASLRFENKFKAGLGLIEIARAGSKSIDYNFYPIGSDRFLFTLAVTI